MIDPNLASIDPDERTCNSCHACYPRTDATCPVCGVGEFRTSPLVQAFNGAWVRCEVDGVCDRLYSVEYRRVYGSWIASICPHPVADFIRAHANLPSELPAMKRRPKR
jgi:hypothetical protein